MKKVITNSTEETIELGEKIGKNLKSGNVIALFGEIGAGKTYLTKGIAKGLGIKDIDIITSPTFKLVNEYNNQIYHIDLFRLEKEKDILNIGLEDFFNTSMITIIEWPEKIKKYLPSKYISIELKILDENKREIKITGISNENISY